MQLSFFFLVTFSSVLIIYFFCYILNLVGVHIFICFVTFEIRLSNLPVSFFFQYCLSQIFFLAFSFLLLHFEFWLGFWMAQWVVTLTSHQATVIGSIQLGPSARPWMLFVIFQPLWWVGCIKKGTRCKNCAKQIMPPQKLCQTAHACNYFWRALTEAQSQTKHSFLGFFKSHFHLFCFI